MTSFDIICRTSIIYLGALEVGGFDIEFGPCIEVFDKEVFKSPGLPPARPGGG